MTKHDAKWTPDVDNAPTTHPKTRDQLVQENRARREAEPAAAPHETDSESGTPGAIPLPPRAQRARNHAAYAAETGQHDVRVGPGDAGASSTPLQTTEPVPGRNDGWSRAVGIIVAALLIGAVVALLF
ncbi:MAG: hypothetical protein AAF914_10860 [Pseudomonadota bacterium]